jgi:2-methylisocitrate lyase-like PEP mutase family enzyme
MKQTTDVSPGRRMRDLFAAPGIMVSPGIYDGFSARLVEQMGFKTAAISGAGLSEANLGWADVGIMGYEENLHASAALAACTTLPLSADADTGYGNAMNVYFTVQGFERAGVACVMIEDQVWPKRCGHLAGKQVISAEEGVEKIRAACEARRDSDFMIKARTDATAIHGVGEAIRRLNLYAEVGADLLFADALLSAEDIGTWRGTCRSRCPSTWASGFANGRPRRCCPPGSWRTWVSRRCRIRACCRPPPSRA